MAAAVVWWHNVISSFGKHIPKIKTCPQQKTRCKPSYQESWTYLPYLQFKGFQLRCHLDSFKGGERWSDWTDIALKFIVLQFCTLKLKKHTDEKCILYFTFTMFSVYDHSWLSNKIILSQFCTFKLEKQKAYRRSVHSAFLQFQYSLSVTIADLTAYQ